MQDCIEKEIAIDAPVSRVWRAITDVEEFSAWFGVNLESQFVVGAEVQGFMTHPKYTHIRMKVTVETMEPESRFAYRWLPYALDPDVDYSKETPTTVTFYLSPTEAGTHLRVTECGFHNVPEWRREIAFQMNSNGWEQQVARIQRYVMTGSPNA